MVKLNILAALSFNYISFVIYDHFVFHSHMEFE